MSVARRGIVLAAVYASCAGLPALAQEGISITGTYVQNADVHSNFGVCTFLKQEREGKTLSAQMSCNGPGGNMLLGDVRFTVRDEKTVEFIDQDNTYHSVLYRCPQSDSARQAPATTSGAR
jgi:hypothetical protein